MFARPTSLSFTAALRDIHSDKPKVRVAAADKLGDADGEEERTQAFEALAAVIGDARPEVRTTACLALAALGRHDAWEIIALCLSDQVPETRQAAAIALGTLGAKDSFPALAEALAEGPNDLRFQAASSMVEVDARAAYKPLLNALDECEDSEVLGAIALGLGAIGNKECVEKIAPLLDQSSSQTRLDAAYALAQLGDLRAKAPLAAALPAKEGGWDAVCALEELGPSSSEPLLAFLVSGKGEVQVRLRAASALLALDQEGQDLAHNTLTGGLRERKYELRALAVQLLEEHGDSRANAPLSGFRKTRRSKGMREDIDQALASISLRSNS